MHLKGLAIAVGVGAAVGAVAILAMPKNNPTRKLAAKAAHEDLVKAGLVPSKSEARRAVEQGGVTVEGEKVTDIKAIYTAEVLKNGIVVRRGKKAFKKVVLN